MMLLVAGLAFGNTRESELVIESSASQPTVVAPFDGSSPRASFPCELAPLPDVIVPGVVMSPEASIVTLVVLGATPAPPPTIMLFAANAVDEAKALAPEK
jgi:hypothetical protein